MTSSPDSKWFKSTLELKGYSQRKFSKLIGLDPSAFSRSLKGDRKFTLEETTTISSLLNIPLEEVLDRLGIDVGLDMAGSKGSLPLCGCFDHNLCLNPNLEAIRGQKHAPFPFGNPKAKNNDIGVAKIQSSSFPIDGALIYFKRGRGIDIDSIGKLCVIKIKGEGPEFENPRLRILHKGRASGRFTLHKMNGKTDVDAEEVRIEWVWPVVWMKV